MDKAELDDIRNKISRHEGRLRCAYQDSVGLWTTGVGFNLERAGADAALARAGVNRDIVWAAIEEAKKAGRKRTVDVLTEDQIDSLLEADVKASVADCLRLCPDMLSWPEGPRFVLIDLHYNMGGATLRTFKNTLTCFRNRDWKQAADNLEKSKWYKQVGKRARDNCALLRAA